MRFRSCGPEAARETGQRVRVAQPIGELSATTCELGWQTGVSTAVISRAENKLRGAYPYIDRMVGWMMDDGCIADLFIPGLPDCDIHSFYRVEFYSPIKPRSRAVSTVSGVP